jgi:hypothetical protein
VAKQETLTKIRGALHRGVSSTRLLGETSDGNVRRIGDANYLALYDYRQAVSNLGRWRSAALEAGGDQALICDRFRMERDELFARHPQFVVAPIQKAEFRGLSYFPCS